MQDTERKSNTLLRLWMRFPGRIVEDDYANIDALEEIGVIDEKLAENLKKCNGLRSGSFIDTTG